MKKNNIYLIILGVTFLLLITSLVLVLTIELDWWLFFGNLIFFGTGWMGIGIFELINLTNKKPVIEKIELESALKMAVEFSLHHPHNPDNFLYRTHQFTQVGESGGEMTNVLILKGRGSELGEDRIFIIKVENKDEFSLLIDQSDTEIKEATIRIAKSQPNPVITEQIPGVDQFGRPTTRFITKTTSRAEIKKEEENKKAEEESAF